MNTNVHAAGIIFENERGEILVLRRGQDTPEGGTWGLPGGKAGPGESGKSAAIYKAKAEINHIVTPTTLEFTKTYHWDRTDLNITFDVFRTKVMSGDMNLQIDPKGHTEYTWMLPVELYARDDLMQGLYPILKDTYTIDD